MEQHNLSSRAKSTIQALSQLSNSEFIQRISGYRNYSTKDKFDLKKSSQSQENVKINELIDECHELHSSNIDIKKLVIAEGLTKERTSIIASEVSNYQRMNFPRRYKLIDLEWKFGVVAGSSKNVDSGMTFVQIKLVMKNDNGKEFFEHVEMSLDKFYDFLHKLNRAQATLEVMSGM